MAVWVWQQQSASGGLGLAATVGKLRQDRLVARLHGVDDLVRRQADLVANLSDGILHVADSRLHLLGVAVERRGKLLDSVSVALDGTHQKLSARVAVEFSRDSPVQTTTTEQTAAVVPSED